MEARTRLAVLSLAIASFTTACPDPPPAPVPIGDAPESAGPEAPPTAAVANIAPLAFTPRPPRACGAASDEADRREGAALAIHPDRARVGAVETLEFAYTLPRAFAASGGLALEFNADRFGGGGKLEGFLMSPLQRSDPGGLGYVEACVERGGGACDASGVRVEVKNRIARLTLTRALAAGDRVVARYRGRMRGNAGTVHWKLASDDDGDGVFDRIPYPAGPRFRFLPARAAYLQLVAPADVVASPDGRFALALVAHDVYGNLAEPFRGAVELAAEPAGALRGLPARLDFAAEGLSLHRVENLWYARPGLQRVVARTEPPLPVYTHYSYAHAEPPLHRRLFGDTHFHTGTGTEHGWYAGNLAGDHRGQYTDARQAYEFVRRVSRLDFASLSEHDVHMTECGWEEVVRLADALYEPGRFTTFHAYEWSSELLHRRRRRRDRDYAHQIVLYRDDALGLFRYRDNRMKPAHIHFGELIDALDTAGAEGRALVIPHPMVPEAPGVWEHPIFDTNPEHRRVDERYQRIAEFHSHHSNLSAHRGPGPVSDRPQLYEDGFRDGGLHKTHTLQYAWGAQGLHVGVIGSSDNHLQTPGLTAYTAATRHAGSLAVALATENTREGVFDALYARRTYGTSGPRIYLAFDADGRLPGERYAASQPPSFGIRVGGTHDLAEVSVMKFADGAYAALAGCGSRAFEPGVDRFEGRCVDPDFDADGHYYLRVVQRDLPVGDGVSLPGSVALSTPIWIDRARP